MYKVNSSSFDHNHSPLEIRPSCSKLDRIERVIRNIFNRIMQCFQGGYSKIGVPFRNIDKTSIFVNKRHQAQTFLEQGKLHKAFTLCDAMALDEAPESYYQDLLESYGLKPGEWTVLHAQKPIHADPLFNTKARFTELEGNALKLLKNCLERNSFTTLTDILLGEKNTDKISLNDDEIHLLKTFFAHIYDNSGFNARLSKMIDSISSEYQKSFDCLSNTLNFLRDYSHKSKNFHHLSRLVPKIEKIASLVETNQTSLLKEEDKIHLSDLKMAISLGKLNNFISCFEKYGICDHALKNIKDQIRSLGNNIQILEKHFSEQLGGKTGDIYIDDFHKFVEYNQTSRKIAYCYAPEYGHASVGLKLVEGSFKMEVMATQGRCNLQCADNNGYIDQNKLSLENFYAANIYRLNFSKLLTQHGKTLLQEKYSDSLEQVLLERYQNIVKEFYRKHQNLSIYNPFFHQITSVFKFSKTLLSNDFDHLSFKGKDMLCSEFVAGSVGLFIHQLENSLQEEMQDLFPKKEGEQLHPILVNPFQYTHFSATTPDRLYHQLKKFVEEVEPPVFMKDIIKR